MVISMNWRIKRAFVRFFCAASFGFFYKEQKRGKEGSQIVEHGEHAQRRGPKTHPQVSPAFGHSLDGNLVLASEWARWHYQGMEHAMDFPTFLMLLL